jgi:hypothetical protein
MLPSTGPELSLGQRPNRIFVKIQTLLGCSEPHIIRAASQHSKIFFEINTTVCFELDGGKRGIKTRDLFNNVEFCFPRQIWP